MSISHAATNDRVNRLFRAGLRGEALAKRVATLRQWQRLGMEEAVIDYLLMAVPLRVRMRGRNAG